MSSPGLDRPLKVPKDYQRVQGQLLRVTVKNATGKDAVVIGRLVAVTDIGIQVVDERKKSTQEHSLSWSEIVKAKIEVEF